MGEEFRVPRKRDACLVKGFLMDRSRGDRFHMPFKGGIDRSIDKLIARGAGVGRNSAWGKGPLIQAGDMNDGRSSKVVELRQFGLLESVMRCLEAELVSALGENLSVTEDDGNAGECVVPRGLERLKADFGSHSGGIAHGHGNDRSLSHWVARLRDSRQESHRFHFQRWILVSTCDGITFRPEIFGKISFHRKRRLVGHWIEELIELRKEFDGIVFDIIRTLDALQVVLEPLVRIQSGHPNIDTWLGRIPVRIFRDDLAELGDFLLQKDDVNIVVSLSALAACGPTPSCASRFHGAVIRFRVQRP